MLFRVLLVLSLLLLASGCATRGVDAGNNNDEGLQRILQEERPHVFFAASRPFPRLTVEVDAVEGARPDAAELGVLRDFFTQHADKPLGVQVFEDDIIPRGKAKQRSAKALALEYFNGPFATNTVSVYVLFYRSGEILAAPDNPTAALSPRPGIIFMNRSYGRIGPFRSRRFGHQALEHECAHLLGLCSESSHGDGTHCTNRPCLMNASLTLRYSRLLRGKDPCPPYALCEDCRSDLSTYQALDPLPSFGFHGPWFVRAESGYRVFYLPRLTVVHVGPAVELPDKALREARFEQAAQLDPGSSATAYHAIVETDQPLPPVLSAMGRDKDEVVREVAERLRDLSE